MSFPSIADTPPCANYDLGITPYYATPDYTDKKFNDKDRVKKLV